jgi:3-dehydroquinate synthase
VSILKDIRICRVFNQPDFVICDPDMLKSLPDEEILNGMRRDIKHGAIAV